MKYFGIWFFAIFGDLTRILQLTSFSPRGTQDTSSPFSLKYFNSWPASSVSKIALNKSRYQLKDKEVLPQRRKEK